jgi:hypothetical protein
VTGTVGVAAGGVVTPVGTPFTSSADGTWTQRLPASDGRFLLQLTRAGAPNRDATTSDGRNPDILLYAGFYDHQCP